MEKNIQQMSSLKALHAEHQHLLELCSRIRLGLNRKVEVSRIRGYTEWFSEHYLDSHFKVEEKLVFPLLRNNVRVKRALSNHRRIKKLLSCSCEDQRVLNLLEEELSRHVRFEERIIYNELHREVPQEQLRKIQKRLELSTPAKAEWQDKFWI